MFVCIEGILATLRLAHGDAWRMRKLISFHFGLLQSWEDLWSFGFLGICYTKVWKVWGSYQCFKQIEQELKSWGRIFHTTMYQNCRGRNVRKYDKSYDTPKVMEHYIVTKTVYYIPLPPLEKTSRMGENQYGWNPSPLQLGKFGHHYQRWIWGAHDGYRSTIGAVGQLHSGNESYYDYQLVHWALDAGR